MLNPYQISTIASRDMSLGKEPFSILKTIILECLVYFHLISSGFILITLFFFSQNPGNLQQSNRQAPGGLLQQHQDKASPSEIRSGRCSDLFNFSRCHFSPFYSVLFHRIAAWHIWFFTTPPCFFLSISLFSKLGCWSNSFF